MPTAGEVSPAAAPREAEGGNIDGGGGGSSGCDDEAVGLTPSFASGFALDRLAEEEEEEENVTFSEDKSETSETSSSSGSSAVGAYAMYSLSAREEGGSDPSALDCCVVEGIVGALAKPRDDCSRSSPQDDDEGIDEGQRLLSGNDHLQQASKMVIPEEKGLTAAVASTRSFGKVRAFSSQCLEGLGWGEGTGGGAAELRRWRGRSESEARISGAYVFELAVCNPVLSFLYYLLGNRQELCISCFFLTFKSSSCLRFHRT